MFPCALSIMTRDRFWYFLRGGFTLICGSNLGELATWHGSSYRGQSLRGLGQNIQMPPLDLPLIVIYNEVLIFYETKGKQKKRSSVAAYQRATLRGVSLWLLKVGDMGNGARFAMY